jgi:hypothetical protein
MNPKSKRREDTVESTSIRRLVIMARIYSEQVVKEVIRDKAGADGAFYEFLRARSQRDAYMHAARIVKEQGEQCRKIAKDRRASQYFQHGRMAA